MILDRLDKCPFCLEKIVMVDTGVGFALQCPKQDTHHSRSLWCWLEEGDPHQPQALNIRIKSYQLHWSFSNNRTLLIHDGSEDNAIEWRHFGRTDLLELPYLLDFELTEENIVNKIQTIKTFI